MAEGGLVGASPNLHELDISLIQRLLQRAASDVAEVLHQQAMDDSKMDLRAEAIAHQQKDLQNLMAMLASTCCSSAARMEPAGPQLLQDQSPDPTAAGATNATPGKAQSLQAPAPTAAGDTFSATVTIADPAKEVQGPDTTHIGDASTAAEPMDVDGGSEPNAAPEQPDTSTGHTAGSMEEPSACAPAAVVQPEVLELCALLDNTASRLREQRATVPQRMADTLAQQLAAQRPMLHALQQLSNACSTPGGKLVRDLTPIKGSAPVGQLGQDLAGTHAALSEVSDRLPALKARLVTAIARLSRVMSALEAEQARPPPCTLERALKARGLEPRPLPQALALAASTNTGSDAITTQGLAGAAGDALASDNTLGLSAAMAMGSLTPLLASPLPGQAARMGVAGEGGVPASAGVKGAAGGVVGILARSLMLP